MLKYESSNDDYVLNHFPEYKKGLGAKKDKNAEDFVARGQKLVVLAEEGFYGGEVGGEEGGGSKDIISIVSKIFEKSIFRDF